MHHDSRDWLKTAQWRAVCTVFNVPWTSLIFIHKRQQNLDQQLLEQKWYARWTHQPRAIDIHTPTLLVSLLPTRPARDATTAACHDTTQDRSTHTWASFDRHQQDVGQPKCWLSPFSFMCSRIKPNLVWCYLPAQKGGYFSEKMCYCSFLGWQRTIIRLRFCHNNDHRANRSTRSTR